MDYPRIHFSGKYYANVNTVNNDQSNYKLSLPEDKVTSGWNPLGGNEWSLQGCFVTSVVYSNGTISADPNREPLIGAAVESNPHSVEGKLVCWDVDAWNKSALFGVTVGIKQSPTSDEFGFIGSLLPNSVLHQNSWYQIPCNLSGARSIAHDQYGARSASKLTSVKWASKIHSEFLQQLRQRNERYGGQLSMSMTLYDFSRDSDAGNFSFGRVSGTIGYAQSSEPRFIEGERLLSFEFVDQPKPTLPKEDPCSNMNYTSVWAYKAPFKVHPWTKSLTVDFSSSFTRNHHQNIRDLGVLYLAILHTNRGRNLCVDKIGTVDYQDDRCRKLNGCIMDYSLSDYHFNLVQSHPLVVVKPLGSDLTTTQTTYPACRNDIKKVLSYDESKMVALLLEKWYYIRPYNYYTFILNTGEIAIVDLLVTVFGQPAFGKTIQIKLSAEWIRPADGLSYNHESIVNRYGYARFIFRAWSIKGYPRQENDLDGQVYQFMYAVKGEQTFCSSDVKYPLGNSVEDHTCTEMITIKVYSDILSSCDECYTKQYTWVDHIQPIFLQYARVYPIMQTVVDLSNYDDITQTYVVHLLNFTMQLDTNHPNYMPVSRDLSSSKRKMILEWLTKPCYNSSHCRVSQTLSNQRNKTHRISGYSYVYIHKTFDEACNTVRSFHEEPHDLSSFYKFTAMTQSDTSKESVDCIKELKLSGCSVYMIQYCLQKAVELEFYTIPLYLTALYSIKDGYNAEVKNIIRGVVMQEMLHMLQASNILISIGGTPIIDSASTAPAYPATGLPGGVFPHLTVSLQKASLDLIYSVFMAIEYPHQVIDSPLGVEIVHRKTIGQLYAEIKKCLKFHDETIFYANRTSLQVKWPYGNDYGNIYIVYDLATAMEGIKEITEQGEGTQPGDPHSFDREDLAHFFKFQEIACGRELVFHGVRNYTYTGDPIPFNESGIWPMRDNPSISGLIPGTKAYTKSKLFHQTYRTLLRKLDSIFTGEPFDVSETVAIMESLEVQAKVLMSVPFNNSEPHGETCGPIFDFYWND